METLKKILLSFLLIIFSFVIGMSIQSWDRLPGFPKNYPEKLYWELYAKPDDWIKADENRKRTFFYELSIERINLPFLSSKTEKSYGAIDNLYSGIFFVSNTGDFFFINNEKEVSKLEVSLPFSRDEFDKVARSENLTWRWFGVKDVLVREQSSSTFQVFVSSNHWNAKKQCHTLQFEMAVFERKETNDFALREDWSTIYETHPCLPLKDRANPFAGLQAGGRIQARAESEVLLTVGDYERDGVKGENKQIITDTTTSYGKIIAVNLNTNESSVISIGHRNPQGLYIDPDGRIWSTEHGPEGGDELNLIEPGENYGWPYVTYGTSYGSDRWPLSDSNGTHIGYKRPVHAWVPSGALSELTGVEGNLFGKWNGDLLIASLRRMILYRTRVQEGRVIYIERIKLGHRLRDIVEMEDGTISIKTDDGTILFLRPKRKDQT